MKMKDKLFNTKLVAFRWKPITLLLISAIFVIMGYVIIWLTDDMMSGGVLLGIGGSLLGCGMFTFTDGIDDTETCSQYQRAGNNSIQIQSYNNNDLDNIAFIYYRGYRYSINYTKRTVQYLNEEYAYLTGFELYNIIDNIKSKIDSSIESDISIRGKFVEVTVWVEDKSLERLTGDILIKKHLIKFKYPSIVPYNWTRSMPDWHTFINNQIADELYLISTDKSKYEYTIERLKNDEDVIITLIPDGAPEYKIDKFDWGNLFE